MTVGDLIRLGARAQVVWDKGGRHAAVGALLALPILYFLRAYLENLSYLGSFGDIRVFHFWWDVSRKTLLEFGQLPFWNPYYCGGMVHWANVQTMFLSPPAWLGLIFGPGAGVRLFIILHFVAGFWGCYVLGRHHGLRGLWAVAPGVAFVFGANFAERSTGHLSFMPFLLLPWLSWAYLRMREDRRFGVLAAALVAYCALAGGPYPFVMFFVYLGLMAAFDGLRDGLWELGPWWRSPRDVAWVAALATGMAALKIFPVADFMAEYGRVVSEKDALQWWQVREVFLEPELVRRKEGYFYVFGEYRNYLGPLIMLSVPAMLLEFRSRVRDYWLIVAAGALMLGNFAWWAPYSLLQEFPIFRSQRVPVRYAILVDLHIGLLFGHMLASLSRALRRLLSRPLGQWSGALAWSLAGLLLLFAAHDVMSNNNTQLEGFFKHDPAVEMRDGPFRMIQGNSGSVYRGPPRNEGAIRCYEANPLRISRALSSELSSQSYLASRAEVDQEGKVRVLEPGAGLSLWTPNVLEVETEVDAEDIVVINQNYHRDWQVSAGELVGWRGLLAARVGPGDYSGENALRFSYRPRRLALYTAVSVLAWLLAVRVLRGRRRRPRT